MNNIPHLTGAEFHEAMKSFEDDVHAIADLANACAAIFEAGEANGLSAERARGGIAVAYHLIDRVQRLEADYTTSCRRTEEQDSFEVHPV